MVTGRFRSYAWVEFGLILRLYNFFHPGNYPRYLHGFRGLTTILIITNVAQLMSNWQRVSTAKQLAEYLRQELIHGHWHGKMPGVIRLAGELGVSRDSVEAALIELEREGLLRAQGRGKRRLIDLTAAGRTQSGLKIAILDYDPPSKNEGWVIDLLHQMAQAGHSAFFASKTLVELGMNPQKVSRLVRETEADAWIVGAGSREVLEWFASQGIPTFALFGSRMGVAIAGVGPDFLPGLLAVIRRLLSLGHRRIVILSRRGRRTAGSDRLEHMLLEEMAAHGLPTGSFNLPSWEDHADGFRHCLDSLFKYTPPTAMIIEEVPHFIATMQFCGERGYHAPRDISLICATSDPAFVLCKPPVSHVSWATQPLIRHVMRWVDNISRGKEDRRQSMIKATFIEGGTIGPMTARASRGEDEASGRLRASNLQ
jgi:DNA-binding LacI/PurR family transcriptional regulator